MAPNVDGGRGSKKNDHRAIASITNDDEDDLSKAQEKINVVADSRGCLDMDIRRSETKKNNTHTTRSDDDKKGTATTNTRTASRQRRPKMPPRRTSSTSESLRRLSSEFSRRRSSFMEETLELPDSFTGWSVVISGLCSAVLGHEMSLQKRLTSPPLVFGQTSDNPLKSIHDQLTHSKESIFARPIQPSLFVGTRGSIASAAAYALGGPAAKDRHITFRQIITMSSDGAKIALDWELPADTTTTIIGGRREEENPKERQEQFLKKDITQPVVLILHGINNDTSFGYMKSLMRACTNRGWVAVGMNYRGCGGVSLSTPRGYTGGYTGDLRSVVLHISSRLAKDGKLFLVGNSLGSNILVKYLGEEGFEQTLPSCVKGGISLGNPLHIDSLSISFPWGHLLSLGARKGILEHFRSFRKMNNPHHQQCVHKALFAATIGEFDKAMAPIFVRNDPYFPFTTKIGYASGEEYWTDASSFKVAQYVSVPLLTLLSKDDFLVYNTSVQKMTYLLENPNIMVVKTKCGGHLGWQESPPDSKNMWGVGTSWADTATTDFIDVVLQSTQSKNNKDGAGIGLAATSSFIGEKVTPEDLNEHLRTNSRL